MGGKGACDLLPKGKTNVRNPDGGLVKTVPLAGKARGNRECIQGIPELSALLEEKADVRLSWKGQQNREKDLPRLSSLETQDGAGKSGGSSETRAPKGRLKRRGSHKPVTMPRSLT